MNRQASTTDSVETIDSRLNAVGVNWDDCFS